MNDKPKRPARRRPAPKEAAPVADPVSESTEQPKPIVEPINDTIDMVTGEKRPVGRPPKEASLRDAVIKLKEAQVILQMEARRRNIDGGRANRVVRDIDTMIRIINKVTHAYS